MSKPLFWIVFVPGRDYKKFTSRSMARVYAGLNPGAVIKAMGF